MKIALLATLIAVTAVAAFNPSFNTAIFKPGEQYVYHYKGQILNGIPKSTNQFSGLLIDSLVVLQFQQDYKVVMKLENIKISKVNNEISSQPTEILPESEATLLTGDQRNLLTQQLIKPIKFRYFQGDVRDLEIEIEDPYWSVNIKKGIISLFQVTLREKGIQTSESSYRYDPMMSRIRSYSSRSQSQADTNWKVASNRNSVFDVMETDVTGNCLTKYTVMSDKTQPWSRSSVMYVSRVKDFENCNNRPFYIQGIFQGVPGSVTEKPIVQPVVKTDYVISGDANHFLIREATLRGKYLLLVNGLEGIDISGYTVQKLTLKHTQPISTPVHLESSVIDAHGLVMRIPKSDMLSQKESSESRRENYDNVLHRKKAEQGYKRGLPSYEMNEESEDKDVEYSRETNSIIPAIEDKLEKLLQCLYSPNTDKKCSNYLLELTFLLRDTRTPELRQLYNRYVTSEEVPESDIEYRKSEILLDVLPTLTSQASGVVLVELIRDERISPFRSSLLVKALSLVVKPTPLVIKNLLELFKELPKETTGTTLSGKALLRQSALLAVGTLTHRLIVVMRSHGKPVPEFITLIDSVSMELKRMLEQARSESEKILVLKSMGNMGASENIMILKNIAEDRRQSLAVRIYSVFGLRRLAKEFKKQVIPILMGVFMDVKEIRELRQASFVVIIKANPSLTTLQMIAHRLRHEPSSQIRTFVYSNLINLAFYTSHQPEHKTLVKDVRTVIKSMKPVSVQLFDSMSVFVNKFSEEYDLGAAFELTKIKSPLSGLPEAIAASLQGTLLGKHRDLLETGVEGKSLEAILRKVFGPHGLLKAILKGEVSLKDIFSPLRRPDMGGVEHKMREILNAMMLELRSDEKAFASWYIQLLGNELQYIILNSENLEDIVHKCKTALTEFVLKLSEGIKVDVVKSGVNLASLTLPSPIGVPLHVNHTTLLLLKTEGSLHLKNLPTISNIFRGEFSFKPQVDLDLDLKTVFETAHFATFAVGMRWLNAGVGTVASFKTAQPLKLNALVKIPEQTISFKYFVPQEPVRIFHSKVAPFTFVSYVTPVANRLPFIKEVKEINNNEIIRSTPFEYEYEGTTTGLGYKMQGVYSLCKLTRCPILPVFGKQEIVILSRPTVNVEYVELKIESLKTNFNWEGVLATESTERFYEEERDSESREHSSDRTWSRQSVWTSSEFEPITVDQIFQNEVPIKRQLRVIIRPSNRHVPEIKSQITWLMARNYWANQLNIQVLRPAFQNMPSWKVIADKVVNPAVWYPEESYIGHRGEYLLKSVLSLHIDDNVNTIKLKIVPGSPIDFSEELKQHTIMPVDDLPETKVQKYKYTLEVEFPEVRNYHVMKMLTVVQDTIKYHLYDKLTAVVPHTPLNNKLVLSVELLPWWEKMNVIVKSPREDLYITNVPFYWNPFQPTNQRIKLHNTYSWNHYKPRHSEGLEESSENVQYYGSKLLTGAECAINYRKHVVTTFDGSVYSIDRAVASKILGEGCGVLGAQDCSGQGLFSFYVYPRNLSSWVAGILLPKADIDIKVLSDRVTVSVNGEEILKTSSKLYTIPSTESEERAQYVIENLGEEVVIKAKELGATVHINQREHTAYVRLSPTSMLDGNMCGMCGNYNKDPSDDLLVPKHHKIPSSRPSYLSYVIPSETCDADSQQVIDDFCKKTTHVTVRRYDNETPMTCTTERKVIQCAKGCRPSQTRSVKTCFRCQSESGQTWSRTTYYQPNSVWELDDSNVSCDQFSERLELPTTCVRAY